MRPRPTSFPRIALAAGLSCGRRAFCAAATPAGKRAAALALLLAGYVMTWAAPAWAVKIRVKGSAHVEAVATAEPEGFVLRGELTDDVGVPIPSSSISISATSPDGPRPVQLSRPQACDGVARSVSHPRPDEYVVVTDERGTFCVRSRTPMPRGALRLRYAATTLYEAVEQRVPIDEGEGNLARTVLRFEPAPELIDLDKETVAITASLRVDRRDSSRLGPTGASSRQGLTVVLEDERGAKIGEAQTGGDGRARFEIKTAALAGPGSGELRLRFDASGTLARATASQAVVRRAQVALTAPAPPEAGDPEDGIPIAVEVRSARGPVTEGVVEALRGGESVGAAQVEAGKATVIAEFAADRSGTVPITLRYVPSAPWWRAGPMIEVAVRVAGPGFLRHIVLAVLVSAFAAWVLAGWRRAPKKTLPVDLETATSPPSGKAGVQVLGATSGKTGWRGHVADAHEGTPIAGARLRIVVPSFEGDGVVAEATSDERGTFALEGAHRSDARLVVESPHHSTYEQALPQPSVLGVALVTRRRALLDRLVRWARRVGAPYDGPPEPTPGHVRRVAGRTEAAEVEAWARRVEDAAYGQDDVDSGVEGDVRAAEPHGPRADLAGPGGRAAGPV